MIKSKRVKWVEHVECMGYKTNACRVFVERPKRKKNQHERLDIDERIILSRF
jgi:hypothetical protein